MNEDKIYPSMVIRSQAEAIELLKKENQQLKDKIKKAIEYINHFSKDSEVKIYGIPDTKVFIGDIEQLLDILKGDKE